MSELALPFYGIILYFIKEFGGRRDLFSNTFPSDTIDVVSGIVGKMEPDIYQHDA